MSNSPRLFKRAFVRDPQGQAWTIAVEDRLNPEAARLARDSAVTFGRYAMIIHAPNGQSAEVLTDANAVQTDNEMNRYRREIAAGSWGADLLAEPAAAEGAGPKS